MWMLKWLFVKWINVLLIMKNHVSTAFIIYSLTWYFYGTFLHLHTRFLFFCSYLLVFCGISLVYSFIHLFCFFYYFADIKKQFTTPPQAMRVEAGGRAEIRCGAPEGIPKPKIQWLKNGSPIAQDSSVLVTNEGHVLISHAELPVRSLH